MEDIFAAQTYFGKDVKDLDLAQSALIAGLLPAPTDLSPINGDLNRAMARQKFVLEKMYEDKKITKDQLAGAEGEKLSFKGLSITDNPISARDVAKTSVDTDGGITLVINANNETPQRADIYVQRTDQSSLLIKYSVEIPEEGGALDIENDLPTGQYRIILISNNQGMAIDFQTKEIL